MNNKLITLIIPVYNVDKYLIKCLTSVLSQITEAVELIVINDGSTDQSGLICERVLQNQNTNVIYLTQENVGLSATRNRGISIATGDYIMFLDSDDELADNTFLTLIDNIQKFPDVDIFYYDAAIVDEIGNIKNKNRYNRKSKIPGEMIFDSMNYFAEYYVDSLVVSACLCLIRRNILLDNSIRFDEGRLYEDNVFSLNTILKSKKVCYLPFDLYIRRYRLNSITTKRATQKDVEDACYVIARYIAMSNDVLEFHSVVICNSFLSLVYKTYIWAKYMMNDEELILKNDKDIDHQVIEFLQGWPEEYKGFSYWLFVCMTLNENDECLMLNSSFIDSVKLGYINVFNELEKYASKRLAIYGRGKHTSLLIEKYEKMMGKKLDFRVYADTFLQDGYDDDKKIVNIEQIKYYADSLLISSYEYRLEMIKKCKELQIDIDIIDLYETEKINMFDERLDFIG